MIKLIVNPRGQPAAYTIKKTTIIIGSSENPEADVSLSQENLQPVHIKIIEQSGKFIAVNEANDPFATVNDLPFGKKVIRANDLIKIGNTEILFQEGHPSISADLTLVDTASQLPAILEAAMAQKRETTQSTSSPHTQRLASPFHMHPTEKEDDFDLEEEMRLLDSWLQATSHLSADEGKEPKGEASASQSVENNIIDFQEAALFCDEACDIEQPPAAPAPQQQLTAPKQTIKDLYFKDSDEESVGEEDKNHTQNPDADTSLVDWHTIWIIIVGVISTVIIIGLLLYANASGKSEDNELKAAEGISDIAMALAHAQLKNIIPQNQNWSDPEFLKSNLTAVLSPEHPPLVQIDSQGQFSNSSYLLRIYTSSDLSNFLIIAQPSPSLLHWLIPKSTILVYSKDMELRKTTDLKSLNRILVNPTLDGSVAAEVAAIVKKGELINLSSISKRQQRLGFALPKELALLHPGSENLIYNAPRYYRFSESIIQKAVELSKNQENNEEITHLRHEINALRRYPYLVMYSSQGLQAAIQAQKALTLFERDANFLIAYLQQNSHGAIQSSRLLTEDSHFEIAYADHHPDIIGDANFTPPLPRSEGLTPPPRNVTETEIAHPLFFELSALSATRQEALKPISMEIVALLRLQDEQPQLGFEVALKNLTGQYLLADAEQNKQMIKGIAHIRRDYATMSLSEFMHYAHCAGLETLAHEGLKGHIQETQQTVALSEESITDLITKIQKSSTLAQLEDAIHETRHFLATTDSQEPEKTIALQNSIKKEILEKVDAFLLSSNQQLPASDLILENLSRLAAILKSAWVTDKDEVEYYLNEFKLLVEMHPPSEAATQAKAPKACAKESSRFWQLTQRQNNPFIKKTTYTGQLL